jgi:hypothetical protein
MNASQNCYYLNLPYNQFFMIAFIFFDGCFYYNETMPPAFPADGLPSIILGAQNVITKIYDEIIIL